MDNKSYVMNLFIHWCSSIYLLKLNHYFTTPVQYYVNHITLK